MAPGDAQSFPSLRKTHTPHYAHATNFVKRSSRRSVRPCDHHSSHFYGCSSHSTEKQHSFDFRTDKRDEENTYRVVIEPAASGCLLVTGKWNVAVRDDRSGRFDFFLLVFNGFLRAEGSATPSTPYAIHVPLSPRLLHRRARLRERQRAPSSFCWIPAPPLQSSTQDCCNSSSST